MRILIGISLQKARRERKISLKKAYEDTRIKIKYLIALEEDNYDLFSADIYIKGFLRNYANYLGLDGDELIKIYEEQYPSIQTKPEIGLKKLKLRSLKTERMYHKRFRLIIIGIISIIIIWLITKNVFHYFFAPAVEKSSIKSFVSNKELVSDKKQEDKLYIQVDIKEITWLRVIVDGIMVEERNFYPGESKSWNVREKIKLRIGNVWGLDLRLNNKLIDIISPSKGAVLDLTFNKEMLKSKEQRVK